jgi:hypothetical protein
VSLVRLASAEVQLIVCKAQELVPRLDAQLSELAKVQPNEQTRDHHLLERREFQFS